VSLDGNAVNCDAYACRATDDVEGVLPEESVRIRYAVLGWTYEGTGADERQFCPRHGSTVRTAGSTH